MRKHKPYNSGQWTEARMRSFVMSALRRAQWPPKYAAIKAAFVRDGPNPKTGRKCKLHKCPICKKNHAKGDMHSDHIQPVVPLLGFENKAFLGYDWNELIPRLFCEVDGYQPICKTCHKEKTAQERIERNKIHPKHKTAQDRMLKKYNRMLKTVKRESTKEKYRKLIRELKA